MASLNRSLAALALALGLVACTDTPPTVSHPAEQPPAEPPVSVPPDTARASGDSAVLALEGEGLRLFLVASGSARPVPFGTPMAETLRIVSATQRTDPVEQGENADCGGTFATWENGLSLWFTRDRFAGWSVRGGTGTLTTAGGVGMGSTRRELEDAYAMEVTRTSVGVEFTAGGLAGLLDSAGQDGRVVALWAGVICQAR